MIVDVAHASAATIDDVLAIATRPVVASHTGVRGVADNARNLSDEHLRGIADDRRAHRDRVLADRLRRRRSPRRSPARSATPIDVAGVEHVGLGSDFDGAVQVPFDATGMVLLTEALLDAGLVEDQIAQVMGGNALRLLADLAARGLNALGLTASVDRSDERRDERRGARRAVRRDRAVVDRPIDLDRDGLGDDLGIRGRVVHPSAAAVALEPVARRGGSARSGCAAGSTGTAGAPATSSIVVVRPPWTTARSQAARCRYRSGTKARTSTPAGAPSDAGSMRGPATAIIRRPLTRGGPPRDSSR